MRTLALGLMVTLFALQARADIGAEAYGKAAASVVQVYVSRGEGRVGAGSAVIIAPGKLITNCHGTRGARRIAVVRGAEQIPATLETQDVLHDLCALSVPEIRGPVAELDSGALEIGQAVFAAGYSGGLQLRVTDGEVKALYPYDGALVVRNSARFTVGASGGGLFNASGKLVGILAFKSTAGDDFHYALPVQWLTSLPPVKAGEFEPASQLTFWEKEPFFLRAAALQGIGAWDELTQLAQAWTAAEPDNAEAWLALGRAYLALDRAAESVRALERALSLKPRHIEAARQLARASEQLRLPAAPSRPTSETWAALPRVQTSVLIPPLED